MKYLAIDYGRKRIGLAVGEIMPRGFGMLENDSRAIVIKKIKSICVSEGIDKIIIGMPQMKSGDKPEIALEIENFAAELSEATTIDVIPESEEYSSVEAEEEIRKAKVKFNKKDGLVDQMAAVIILEQYLKSQHDGRD